MERPFQVASKSFLRHQVGVKLVNLGEAPFRLECGNRITQLVIAPVARLAWRESEVLPESARGGFGPTGWR